MTLDERRRRVPVSGLTLSAILTDVVIWIVATDLAALARYDFAADDVRWKAISILALFLAGGQLFVGGFLLFYRRRYEAGSFDEMLALAVSATVVCAVSTSIVAAIQPPGVPRSVPFMAWPLALLGMAGVRLIKRLISTARRSPNASAEPIIVIGAGWVGSALVNRMLRYGDSPYLPVALLDDDPAKHNLQIYGVRVRGTLADLEQVAREFDASKVVVAVNNADAALLRKISDAADAAGIGCLVLPPLKDVTRGAQLHLSALREIDVEDVIGRRPVETDITSIAEYVTGRRVLVTGAGGSIGSELCRQLHKFGPAELIMLDRDESALHAVELSIYGRSLLESPEIVLADIRDARRGE